MRTVRWSVFPDAWPTWGVVVAATAVIDGIALIPGWWWATLVVGVAVAATVRGVTALAALLVGTLVGWTAMLLIQGAGHLDQIAGVVGAVATGERGQAWLAFTVTYVTAGLLALGGAWLGAAVRRLLNPADGTAPGTIDVAVS
jgi:hypothetical protein